MKTNALLRSLVFGAIALFAPACSAIAQTTYVYFPDDTTIDYRIPTSAIVGYANAADVTSLKGSNPTVRFITNSFLNGYLQIFKSSTVNISDGYISAGVYAYDSSKVNISGGHNAFVVEANNNSSVTITGGSMDNSVYATGNAVVNIIRGSFQDPIYIENNGIVNLSGGSIRSLHLYGPGTLNIFGIGLSITLINPDVYGSSQYVLSGRLADGTDLTGKNLYVKNGTAGTVNLEDSTTSLSVSGPVLFSDSPDKFFFPSSLTVDFFAAGSLTHNTPIFSRSATVHSGYFNPSYTIIGVLPGTYDIGIRGPGTLRKIVPNVALREYLSSIPLAVLPGGDANGDNTVDIGDSGALINAYGGVSTDPASGYDPAADFNYDGLIDIGDFGILVNNYNLQGDL